MHNTILYDTSEKISNVKRSNALIFFFIIIKVVISNESDCKIIETLLQ